MSFPGNKENKEEDVRRRSIEHGPIDSTVSNKLRALIIAAAHSNDKHHSICCHRKNTTGIVGHRDWSDDEHVNRLWEKYSLPVPNSKTGNMVLMYLMFRCGVCSSVICSTRSHYIGKDPF